MGEELGSITVYRTILAALISRMYMLREKRHYKLSVTFMILLIHLTLRRLMTYIYIYGAPILDVSRSHTTT